MIPVFKTKTLCMAGIGLNKGSYNVKTAFRHDTLAIKHSGRGLHMPYKYKVLHCATDIRLPSASYYNDTGYGALTVLAPRHKV